MIPIIRPDTVSDSTHALSEGRRDKKKRKTENTMEKKICKTNKTIPPKKKEKKIPL